MARMSIDDMIGRDPRLLLLADEMGERSGDPARWDRRYTAGVLVLDVWPLCYDRASELLPARDIDRAVGVQGFAEAMICAGLATHETHGVRISGAQERVRYLVGQTENGRKGGQKSGESRRNKREAKSKHRFGDAEAPANLPSPVPDPVSASSIATAPAPSEKKGARLQRDAHPDFKWLVDEWFARFERVHGARPTWSGREGKALNALLTQHKATEIVRRMCIALDYPRSFPPQPWGFLVFAARFDEVAQPVRDPRRRETANEAAKRLVREAEDDERPPWEDA